MMRNHIEPQYLHNKAQKQTPGNGRQKYNELAKSISASFLNFQQAISKLCMTTQQLYNENVAHHCKQTLETGSKLVWLMTGTLSEQAGTQVYVFNLLWSTAVINTFITAHIMSVITFEFHLSVFGFTFQLLDARVANCYLYLSLVFNSRDHTNLLLYSDYFDISHHYAHRKSVKTQLSWCKLSKAHLMHV